MTALTDTMRTQIKIKLDVGTMIFLQNCFIAESYDIKTGIELE